MSGGQKALAIGLCLLFGLPGGGVAIFASWVAGSTLFNWQSSRDWVRVKADLLSYDGTSKIRYRYVMGGVAYEGDRLSVAPLAKGDQISDDADTRIQVARGQKNPLMVFVNPADPSQSFVDRELPWTILLILTPFVIGFGAVGLGAFWVLTKVLGGDEPEKPQEGPRSSDARRGLIHAWVFTVLWNSVAIPAAILAVPQMLERKDYVGLFVLIFPLIGIFVLWAAISATIGYLRRGGARLHLTPENPRAGSAVQGFIAFPRGVSAGQSFKSRLICNRVTGDGNNRASKIPKWSKEQTLRTTQTPGGVRLPFRFEVPADVPGSRRKDGDTAEYKWRIEATLAEVKRALPYGFEFDLQPAPAEAFAAEPAAGFEEEPRLATLGPEFAKLELLAESRGIRLDNDAREQLAALSANQRELAVKALQFGPKIKKIVIWIVVAVVGFQILGAIVAVVTAMKSS
jgi:hypothetical protein